MGLELFQILIPRESSLFDLSGGTLEDLTCKPVFILPDQSLSDVKSFFSQGHRLKKEKNQRQLWLPEAVNKHRSKQ